MTCCTIWCWFNVTNARTLANCIARCIAVDPLNPNVTYGEGVPCARDAADTGVLNWTEVIGEALDGMAILDAGAPGWTAADRAGHGPDQADDRPNPRFCSRLQRFLNPARVAKAGARSGAARSARS